MPRLGAGRPLVVRKLVDQCARRRSATNARSGSPRSSSVRASMCSIARPRRTRRTRPRTRRADLRQRVECRLAPRGDDARRLFTDDPAITVAYDGIALARIHLPNGSAASTVAAVEFESAPEQEQFRAVVRDFAEAEIAPHAADWDRDHTFPVETVRADGCAGPVRPPVPRGVRRLRRRLPDVLHRDRGDRAVDASLAITLEAGVSLGAAPSSTAAPRRRSRSISSP